MWNQLVAHGSAPNYSSRARYAQFVKYQRAVPLDSERGQCRKHAIAEQVGGHKHIHVSSGGNVYISYVDN